MSGADFANTTGTTGSIGAMPPANIDTPAAEWSDKVLAAVHAPTAHTGGYSEAAGPVKGVPASSSSGLGAAGGSDAAPASSSLGTSSAPADKNLAGLQHAVQLPPAAPAATPAAAPFPHEGDASLTAHLAGLAIDPSSSSFAPVTGGGLATSPNVPQGITTNALTGAPHSAGLTRAELHARNAEAATGTRLEDLSPREQAAAQLGRLGALQSAEQRGFSSASTAGESTPGQELPGGWGPVTPIPAAGTSATHPTTSIYEDVQHAVQNLSNAAYSAVPAGLKERVQSLQTSPSKTAGGLLDQAKGLLNSVSQSANPSDPAIAKTDQSRVPGTVGAQGGLVAQARELVHEIAEVLKGDDHLGHATMPVTAPVIGGMGGIAPVTSGVVGGSSHATSSTAETHTGGVGDLPGSSRETGVAVLPEERAHPDTLNERGGLAGAAMAAGAVGAAGLHAGSSSSAGPAHETAVVAKSDDIRDSALTGSSAPAVNSGAGASSSNINPTSSLGSGASSTSAPTDHAQGLAPPLGTFVDATPNTSGFKDETEHGLPEVASIGTAIDARPIAEIPVGSNAAGSGAASDSAPVPKAISAIEPRIAAERADSTTSVTAIRHGEPGNLHKSTNVPSVIGEGNSASTGSKDLPPVPPTKSDNFDAVSRTPGHASAGVGSTPTASSPLATSTVADKTTPNSEPHTDVKSEFAAVGHGTIANPASATPAKEAPTTSSSATTASGHHRESSTSSNGKKSGFLAKVKAKLHHEK